MECSNTQLTSRLSSTLIGKPVCLWWSFVFGIGIRKNHGNDRLNLATCLTALPFAFRDRQSYVASTRNVSPRSSPAPAEESQAGLVRRAGRRGGCPESMAHIPVVDNGTTVETWQEEWNGTAAAAAAASSTLGPISPTNITVPQFCDVWEGNQHTLYQTANLFLTAAFLVPRNYKQSVLLFRLLVCVGAMLTAIWASFHLCAIDVLLWNTALLLVNVVHSGLLIRRFLPPALSPELTELYLKLFRPLRVSKKHFMELAREASVLALHVGETYAVEDTTPADERLSILLRGRLSVTCDGTHLHHINMHQFVDSPEWEANHGTSENTFQVTITAEEYSTYLCWSRIKLARVLRHRPHLKVLLENLIGKDITHKLYSLNEHLTGGINVSMSMSMGGGGGGGGGGRRQVTNVPVDDASAAAYQYRNALCRSVSVDAVHTGLRGHVRSSAFRQERTSSDRSLGRQCWIPLVATQFPTESPFVAAATAAAAITPGGVLTATAAAAQAPLVPVPVIVPVLAPPPTLHQARNRSMRRAKIETPV